MIRRWNSRRHSVRFWVGGEGGTGLEVLVRLGRVAWLGMGDCGGGGGDGILVLLLLLLLVKIWRNISKLGILWCCWLVFVY